MDYEETGILSIEEIQIPSKERMAQRAFAVLECPQQIPCDPCVKACKFGAITKSSLISPPKINFDKCTGCATCVSKCPGLAIFVVNMNYSPKEALVTMPYELEPPKVKERVKVLDRGGKVVGSGKVIKVRLEKDRTGIISIALEKSLAMVVRNIRK
ncbi:MAG: 4Fe-4S binding protein [Candidatus Thermoplasmatota archaeon]|nr:4Fe-4S binding protein [Candidatus Thermoplasmatota archaeon]